MPWILAPALPFAFVTDQMVPVSMSTLQPSRSSASPQPLLIRIYWKEHMDAIKEEFETVRTMGPAATEEWIKGLRNRGKEAQNDAARWEKWGVGAGGFSQIRRTAPFLPGQVFVA
jgi:hypothetical protein